MHTQERTLQDVHLEQERAPERLRGVDAALERLSQVGYRIDRAKVDRFASAGLLPADLHDEASERAITARLRRILDVERMLAPWRDTDALAFYLAAAGVDGVPAEPVARFLAASIPELCAAGKSFASKTSSAVAGLEGERIVARGIAKAALARFRSGGPSTEKNELEQVLSTALVGFVRLRFATPRPLGQLHRHSRIVNLDAEEEAIAKRARTSGALPPIVEADRMMVWLASRADTEGDRVLAAARLAASMVKAHVKRFPELQVPWREVAEACGYPGLNTLRVLSVVPAVFACAILQAGENAGTDADPRRIMQFWGTSVEAPIRFPSATRAFPWFPREVDLP
jgi:hypothetical protein